MPIAKIKEILENCERPLDFFGDVSLDEISKKYKKYAKFCHPDLAEKSEKDLAEETIKLLNILYKKSIQEIKEGIYNVTDKKVLYEKLKPIIEFDLKNVNYKFYKYLGSDEVNNIYEGISDDKIVSLKEVIDEADNNLVKSEYEIFKNLKHLSLPNLISIIKINGKNALIYERPQGLSIEEIIKHYGRIPGRHIAWILERMLSLVGYLHSNKIIHGNIKPENIIIDPNTHNVYFENYSLCIKNANESDKRYQIINEVYTPSYVNENATVIPNVDIYAIGKVAILLLGGDIKRNALPIDCEEELRFFIRKLVDERNRKNDAWELWDELRTLRDEIYGIERFQKLERKL